MKAQDLVEAPLLIAFNSIWSFCVQDNGVCHNQTHDGDQSMAEQEVIVEMTPTGLHLVSSQLFYQRYKSPRLMSNGRHKCQYANSSVLVQMLNQMTKLISLVRQIWS